MIGVPIVRQAPNQAVKPSGYVSGDSSVRLFERCSVIPARLTGHRRVTFDVEISRAVRHDILEFCARVLVTPSGQTARGGTLVLRPQLLGKNGCSLAVIQIGPASRLF